jgi:hypothetical protein
VSFLILVVAFTYIGSVQVDDLATLSGKEAIGLFHPVGFSSLRRSGVTNEVSLFHVGYDFADSHLRMCSQDFMYSTVHSLIVPLSRSFARHSRKSGVALIVTLVCGPGAQAVNKIRLSKGAI